MNDSKLNINLQSADHKLFAYYCFFYLLAWLFPVICSWGVASFGFRFSYVGQEWQNQNVGFVGICIVIALVSGMISSVFFYKILLRIKIDSFTKISFYDYFGVQRIFLYAILILSGIGCYKSFGGNLFEKTYTGPSIAWLGYGAWSVTFLLVFWLVFKGFLSNTKPRIFLVAFLFLPIAFVPFLMCGSRIDFLSIILAYSAYILFFSNDNTINRYIKSSSIFLWGIIVACLIAGARYNIWDHRLPTIEANAIPVKLSTGMIYLGTIGDIGVTFFEAVGLTKENSQSFIGLTQALYAYAERLLPGPFFPDRPADFITRFQNSFEAGACHSLAEGYLVFGLWGVVLVGLFFGMLISVSMFAGNYFRSKKTYLSWIFFALPWLLLIRGGWYQIFSIFKALEILFLLLLLLFLISCFVKKT